MESNQFIDLIKETSRTNIKQNNIKFGDNLTSAALIVNGDEPHNIDDKFGSGNENKQLPYFHNIPKIENGVSREFKNDNTEFKSSAEDSDIDDGPFEVVDDAEINDDDESMQVDGHAIEFDQNYKSTDACSSSKEKTQTDSCIRKRKLDDDSLTEYKKSKSSRDKSGPQEKDEKSRSNSRKGSHRKEDKSKSTEKDTSVSEERKKNKDRSGERDYDKDKRKKEGSRNRDDAKKEECKNKNEIKEDLDKHVEEEKHRIMLEKFWKTVIDDPTDFTGWTYLLQYVDQENDVESAREVFDKFLSLYPYCYGYWRKYCDLLKKNNFKEECNKVFERGIGAVPLSVDLWLHYINHFKSIFNDEELRDLYNKAIEKCGMEYKSDRLWEWCIEWETESSNLMRVTEIYDRWLRTPTLLCLGKQSQQQSVMNRFTEFVTKNSPESVLCNEELFNLRSEILQNRNLKNSSHNKDESAPSEQPLDSDELSHEEVNIMKDKIIKRRAEIHQKTLNYFSTRANFEDGIKRPYFHVKPLEASQLDNWTNYLNHEIAENDQERTIFLFERCLIACAMYERFWIKYVEYLKSRNIGSEKIRNVFTRACMIHHHDNINIRREWLFFEEEQGNFDRATEIIDESLQKFPGNLVLICDKINIEKHRGDIMRAEKLYEFYCNDSSLEIEIISSLNLKYAEFCFRMLGNVQKSRQILQNAIKENKDMRLVIKLIEISRQQNEINVNELIKFLDEVLPIRDVADNWKIIYSQRKLELLIDYCKDNALVHGAYKEYNKLEIEMRKLNKSKKVMSNNTLKVVTDTVSIPVPPTFDNIAANNRTPPFDIQSGQQNQYNTNSSQAPTSFYSYSQTQYVNNIYSTPPPYHSTYQMYNDPNYNYAAYYGNNWQAAPANAYGQYNTPWTTQNSNMHPNVSNYHQGTYPYFK